MFKNEVCKLLHSKFVIFSVLLMLLANFMLIGYQNKDAQTISQVDMDNLIEQYLSNSSAVDANYKQLIASGYLSGDNSELVLYSNLYTQLNYIRGYKPALEKIISAAERTITEYDATEIGQENYSYHYQTNLIEIYGKLQTDTRLGLEFVRGWDSFFTYRPIDIFAFIVIIIVSSYMFVVERRCDTSLILRSCKNGRVKLAVCKVICLFAVVLIISLLFVFTT